MSIRTHNWWCRWGGGAFAVVVILFNGTLFLTRGHWVPSGIASALSFVLLPLWWKSHRLWKERQAMIDGWVDAHFAEMQQRRARAHTN